MQIIQIGLYAVLEVGGTRGDGVPHLFWRGTASPHYFLGRGGTASPQRPPTFFGPPPDWKNVRSYPPGREFPMENFRFVAPPTGKISVPTPPPRS